LQTHSFPTRRSSDLAITTFCKAGDIFTNVNSTPLQLFSLDTGGTITLRATATINGQNVEKLLTFPKGASDTQLPDAYTQLYGSLDPAAKTAGDGFTNREKYRGFVWGKMTRQEADDPQGKLFNGIYQTAAYIPANTLTPFRGNPLRKTLFIKYTGYNTAYPFAIGAALNEAGIDVYAIADTTLSTSTNNPLLASPNNIHVMTITHDPGKLGSDNGHINKDSNYVRFWTWDTKGASAVGNSTTYGSPKTYQLSLDSYFSDRPYKSGKLWNSTTKYWDPANTVLDPVTQVEDKNDDGYYNAAGYCFKNRTTACSSDITCSAKTAGDTCCLGGEDFPGTNTGGTAGKLDGDYYALPVGYGYDFSPFDINKNNKVELPVGDTSFEYSKLQVLKHTITHEIGHALGVPASHTSDPDCVMFNYSINWKRDGLFGKTVKNNGYLMIHNK
jgi:hypothetical protein